MDSSRQTLSFLKRRFAEIGIQPNAKHGQNFLIDLNVLDFIVRSADVGPGDFVLEIGTGTASLTARLAQRATRVLSVEIDETLSQLASEELVAFDNVQLLQQDVLRNKNNFHANVLEAIDQNVQQPGVEQFKLVANLPYNVATPIVSNLFLTEHVPVSMTVMIQKELADRIVAEPSTKDYGSLSVWVQSQAIPLVLRELPPDIFWPRPKVHSSILQIVFSPDKRSLILDLKFFHDFVRTIFLHRRKFLRGSLLSSFKHELDKPTVDAVMAALSLKSDARAEQLSTPQLLELSNAVQAAIANRQ